MKIRIDVDNDAKETEIVIKCKEINEEVSKIQTAILTALTDKQTLELVKDGKEYYISPDELIFFEAQAGRTFAHSTTETFETKLKLYELEELLPRRYLRVSKSTIIDIEKIYSIAKNLTGPSVVQFKGSHKQINVSRQYYNILKNRLKD